MLGVSGSCTGRGSWGEYEPKPSKMKSRPRGYREQRAADGGKKKERAHCGGGGSELKKVFGALVGVGEGDVGSKGMTDSESKNSRVTSQG